jgi:hypothetical protein
MSIAHFVSDQSVAGGRRAALIFVERVDDALAPAAEGGAVARRRIRRSLRAGHLGDVDGAWQHARSLPRLCRSARPVTGRDQEEAKPSAYARASAYRRAKSAGL